MLTAVWEYASRLVDCAKDNLIRRSVVVGTEDCGKAATENEGGKRTPEKQDRDICRPGEGLEPTGSKQVRETGRGLKIRGAIGVGIIPPVTCGHAHLETPFLFKTSTLDNSRCGLD